MIGSVTQQCNVNTGCCFCRDTFRGEKCNECQIGYRDFPQVNDAQQLYNISITVTECAFIVIDIRRDALESLMGSLEAETVGELRKKDNAV